MRQAKIFLNLKLFYQFKSFSKSFVYSSQHTKNRKIYEISIVFPESMKKKLLNNLWYEKKLYVPLLMIYFLCFERYSLANKSKAKKL